MSNLISEVDGVMCITRTGLPLHKVIHYRGHDATDLELRQGWDPPLTQEELDATVAYYESHREEMDAEVEADYRKHGMERAGMLGHWPDVTLEEFNAWRLERSDKPTDPSG